MSDLAELKKLMEGNTKAISALIQAESNSDRIKQEIASNNRVLEGLYAQINEAKSALASVKAETVDLQASSQKHIDELLRDAATAKTEADARLVQVKMLERNAQTKLDDAEEVNKQYQAALADVTAQKEKLKAALV